MAHQWMIQWNQALPHDNDTLQGLRAYSISKKLTYLLNETRLIDGGANGIIAGKERVWIGGPTIPRTIDVVQILQASTNTNSPT